MSSFQIGGHKHGPWYGEARDEDMQYLCAVPDGLQYAVIDDFGNLVLVGPSFQSL